ncbi:MAG: hypothetical protein IPH26_14375 [Sterolibacteriaceae bacterium]|uniref:Uncharacterized protein n=1 Tax=Candidatus Methylophosphatis roskildensis TaxID=2899263 RepID=A0A9D7HMS4_9PROT|nr:hypothetical protein [Candidatus Methylophosphatis roskildensis]MBK7234662.1 hypothetical protein [Sterolibacteriaceae bacterium]
MAAIVVADVKTIKRKAMIALVEEQAPTGHRQKGSNQSSTDLREDQT